MLLGENKGGASFALGVERVERLLQAFLRRFSGVDRAAHFPGRASQVIEGVFTYVAVDFRIKAAAGVKCSRLPLRIAIHLLPEPISLMRLEARSVATLSVEAQERHERRERFYSNE